MNSIEWRILMIRGIEHIGITVTDLGQAEAFFCQALGASVLYRLVASDNPDQTITGDKMSPLNGFPAEMNLTGLAMLRLANGCNVELFQTSPAVQDQTASPGQPGINHFSLYTDDIHKTAADMRLHGAKMFDGPSDCFAQEEGEGNQTWFGMTPFGVLIELISLPAGVHYDEGATERRWIPKG
ncbi:VOC family protein [Leclercia adecarboxylata]|uniref:VOC family protein n=1 Tax=Leclercia adecarboxylata TaxID=83655 RepID=UPI001CD985E6|nr:VOC family protein [Leclercia adecarboxylata]